VKRSIAAALVLSSFAVAGCGGGSVTTTPLPTAAPSAALGPASASVCVSAQSTPQLVQLPDTGGITATLSLAQYDSGASGCQNITIATGADAALAAAAATVRRTASTSPNPLLSITLGAGLPANSSALQLTTVLSGATLATDANVVFPDGTYNATITLTLLGTPFTYSLIFTATNGKLTLTGGSALPLTLGSGAVINVYNRGVVPPGFEAPVATPSPGGTASASPSPGATSTASSTPSSAPSATPSSSATQPVPNGTTIGSATLILSGYPTDLSYLNGQTTTTPLVYNNGIYSEFQTSQQSGVTTYAISGLNAGSYRIDGCTGQVTYGGTGVSGVFTVPPYPYLPVVADSCEVDLFSAPAAVVNAAPNNGYGYLIYVLIGPVAQTNLNGTYAFPPAINT
jgi:hypothetical protein